MSETYMPKNEQIETAISIASRYHKGQTDKNGMPYILHPLAVMQIVSDFVPSDNEDLLMDAKIVAVLHDILEDTVVTKVSLEYYCFPPHIIDAVVALTRLQDETYSDYILRVAENSLTVVVKLADLTHNLRPGCPETLQPRYRQVYSYLSGCFAQIQKESHQLFAKPEFSE